MATTTSDKRRSLPRQSTAPASQLPFPRPLASKPKHRRTQSELPSPLKPTTPSSHHRSRSWLANIFKPNSSLDPPQNTNTQTSRNRKDFGGSLKLFNRTRTTSNRTRIDEFGNARKRDRDSSQAATLPPPTPHLGVYDLPRKPTQRKSMNRHSEESLAKRLASWDWDGGERLEDNSFDTLEIRRPHEGEDEIEELENERVREEEGDLSLVWKGFLADAQDTYDEDDGVTPLPNQFPSSSTLAATANRRFSQRALSPTSTSPPLPPIPFPQNELDNPDQQHENEISFLSLEADHSLAQSTTSRFTLSCFPSPSGGEISFTDPFSFASHLSSPPLARSEARSPSRASTSTLAERRHKEIPRLRLDTDPEVLYARTQQARKQASHATFTSMSVYSRDSLAFANDEEELNQPNLESYFSPISPEYPPISPFPYEPSPSSHESPLPPLPLLPTEPISHPMDSEDLSNQSHSSTSTSSSFPRSSRQHSPLFDRPSVLPPSSTFTNEGFEDPPVRSEPPLKEETGWRKDWKLTNSEQEEEEEEVEEESESEVSEGEVEKRISIYGQRELERRATERRLRWKEEREEIYGESKDAEVEFGLAL